MKFYNRDGKIMALLEPENESSAPAEMVAITENTTDAAVEKHVPVISRDGQKVIVHVGCVDHPMIDVHYIEWIALETAAGVQIKFLRPQDAPQAIFYLPEDAAVGKAYAYCNLHGLWSANA